MVVSAELKRKLQISPRCAVGVQLVLLFPAEVFSLLFLSLFTLQLESLRGRLDEREELLKLKERKLITVSSEHSENSYAVENLQSILSTKERQITSLKQKVASSFLFKCILLKEKPHNYHYRCHSNHYHHCRLLYAKRSVAELKLTSFLLVTGYLISILCHALFSLTLHPFSCLSLVCLYTVFPNNL